MFLENAQHFVAPSYRELVASPLARPADHAALWFVQVAFENKVYALFALLFGYGIALQLARTGAGFVALHVRRMASLFVIGLCHAAFLWSGDILATYALLGLLLLGFRRCGPSVLVGTALFALAAPTLALAALTAALPVFAAGPGEAERVAGAVVELGYPLRQACFAFAMFLLGLAAGRAHAEPGEPARRVPPPLWLALAIGFAGSLAHVAVVDLAAVSSVSWAAVAAEALVGLGGPLLALAYARFGLLALEHPRARRARAPLAAAGRLSLTHYLLQSLIGVALLGRLGVIHPPAGIALACAIYALQVGASRLWLARFRFGPVEWLWRAASYGSLPALRV